MLYKEGGAPAVFQSPKCPRWKLSNFDDDSWSSQTPVCQIALHQGRRNTQEDRIFCNLDVRIPFPGDAFCQTSCVLVRSVLGFVLKDLVGQFNSI